MGVNFEVALHDLSSVLCNLISIQILVLYSYHVYHPDSPCTSFSYLSSFPPLL